MNPDNQGCSLVVVPMLLLAALVLFVWVTR